MNYNAVCRPWKPCSNVALSARAIASTTVCKTKSRLAIRDACQSSLRIQLTFGEEPALVGTNGAGNIFFGNCNLRCVYCQNYQISQTHKEQLKNEITHERLAEIMLELQAKGCHNINFVSPTHFAPQLARSVLLAAQAGLNLPIVYNTNAYDSVEVLRLLEGIVGVYLPDLKYAEDEAGYLYSKVPGYKDHARRAIAEMYRQVGDELVFGEDGLLQRGLIIRLLVLPNDIGGVRESLEWIRDELSPRVAVSLMSQYYPTHQAATSKRHILLSRRITETDMAARAHGAR